MLCTFMTNGKVMSKTTHGYCEFSGGEDYKDINELETLFKQCGYGGSTALDPAIKAKMCEAIRREIEKEMAARFSFDF